MGLRVILAFAGGLFPDSTHDSHMDWDIINQGGEYGPGGRRLFEVELYTIAVIHFGDADTDYSGARAAEVEYLALCRARLV